MEKSQDRKPAEVRKFEILYAATELFCEHDYHVVSMEDVAAKVGVSKATVYLYFSSKLELFFGVIDHAVDKLIAGLEEALTDTAHQSLAEKLDAAQQSLQDYAPIFRASQHLMSTGMPDNDFPPHVVATFMKKMHSRRGRLQEMFVNVFSKAQEKGEVRSDMNPEELATVFGTYGMLMTRSEVSYETAKEILFHGILVKEDKE
ncbi:TetR family transcriptional regulator [candidate division WOR-3 bacterium]|uniref:TetR family transcriptional regulator n=1 Tax=candidate division WOR-3 bacterium TaxID=2052148 RepID=A0A9D5QD69_UNCW3|nr:TetR family transcriptional regulator [candidate division WOR-3 bacterium]MBD3365309.1 TetR family transcriptional regulator [candidate division WOR-3 bacterium]